MSYLSKKFLLFMILSISLVLCQSFIVTNQPTITTAYKQSNENFSNPERGVYVPFDPEPKNGKDDVVYPLELSDLQKVKSQNMSWFRRVYLLEEFRTKPISQSFLKMISNDFAKTRQVGLKMIIRFTYNWLGEGAYESLGGGPDAQRNTILSHLDQLKPILQENYDIIAYMEAGFIGYWGEWHSSTNKLLQSDNGYVTNDSRAIFLKILSVLPDKRMVAIRYVRQKKQIFNNNNPLTLKEAFSRSPRARVGHHNDAFRATKDDAGTYWWGKKYDEEHIDPAIVEEEKTWASLDTKYVVQGGEPAWESTPPEYNDCSKALADFARMHWSGINIEQGDPAAKPVYQRWKTQGCMEKIKRNLGYRFRLVKSVIPVKVKPGGTFSMQFDIANDGWASLYNPRRLEVILRNSQTKSTYYLPVNEEPRNWIPGDTKLINIVGGIPKIMPKGEYQVLLNLPDPTPKLYNRPEYSIRLANQNIWETSTGYNSLLQSIIVDPNAKGDIYSGLQIFKSFNTKAK